MQETCFDCWVGKIPWRRDRLPTPVFLSFPSGSDSRESACNAGDRGSIPGSGRSPGEGIGYPLQYSWASLVAQMVKNPPAMWETWVGSLGWEDPLEEGMATHSSILAWRIPCTVDVGDVAVILGPGRPPGGGHGNPLQHSCLETPMTKEPGWL